MGKGNQWERDISRELSLWWTHGEDDDVFWRVRASGARATQRKKQQGKDTTNQEGDIMAVDYRGLALTTTAVVELKKGYNECGLLPIIDKLTGNKDPIIMQFLDQVVSSCGVNSHGELRKQPILIIKRDRKKAVVATTLAFFDRFASDEVFDLYHTIELHLKLDYLIGGGLDFIFMELEAFKQYCNPDDIEETFENDF